VGLAAKILRKFRWSEVSIVFQSANERVQPGHVARRPAYRCDSRARAGEQEGRDGACRPGCSTWSASPAPPEEFPLRIVRRHAPAGPSLPWHWRSKPALVIMDSLRPLSTSSCSATSCSNSGICQGKLGSPFVHHPATLSLLSSFRPVGQSCMPAYRRVRSGRRVSQTTHP